MEGEIEREKGRGGERWKERLRETERDKRESALRETEREKVVGLF
jgi:hypothetical protein